VADFDNDGNLDVVIANLNRAPVLLRNQGSSADGSWLTIRARGHKSNVSGLGATVRIETSEGTQVREINNVASYPSSSVGHASHSGSAATIVRRLEIPVARAARGRCWKIVKVNQVPSSRSLS
jgi:hypothetical protein